MPSNKLPDVWTAPPHTLAKIQILRSYLQAYFPILGRRTRGADILYIDGFAGPGEYLNDPCGSPVAAMQAALEAIKSCGYEWEARAICLAFIEEKPARVSHLRNVLSQFDNDPLVLSGAIKYEVFAGTFVSQLPVVKEWCPAPFRTSQPLFAFIDPFGATGVPFAIIRDLMSIPCSEVLFNLDADGLARIYEAQKIVANQKILDEFFDVPELPMSWRASIHPGRNHKALFSEVLNLYKLRLREVADTRFVFSFEMATQEAALNYYLVFATNHERGLQKMKESMGRLGQNGFYRFVDTTHGNGQIALFRGDDPSVHWAFMFDTFKGKIVEYEVLNLWVLNESPFTTPAALLKETQNRWLVRIVPKAGETLRKGDFSRQKIASIEFAPARNAPFPLGRK